MDIVFFFLFLDGNSSDLTENSMSTSSLNKMNFNCYITSNKMFPIYMKIFFDIWPKIAFSYFQFFMNWTRVNV